MRVPPPFALTLAPAPGWSRVYPMAAGAAAAVTSGWAVAMFGASIGPEAMLLAGQVPLSVAFAALVPLALGCGLALISRPGEVFWIAWDGRRWALSPVGGRSHATAEHGVLDVMIDLGDWVLLRFRPAEAGPWAVWRHRWLPARLSPGSDATALRATLYAHRGSDEPIAAPWLL